MKVLIIGGNRGLGLEWVKFFLNRNDTVIATYHNPEHMNDFAELLSQNLANFIAYPCDVTDDDSVNALAEKILAVDLIIYNSGIKGYQKKFCRPDENTTEELNNALAVNCVGVDRVIRALLPHITQSNVQFIYMSAGVSNVEQNYGGNYHPYRISKAAGNMAVRNWDIEVARRWYVKGGQLEERPVLYALNPGFVDVGMAAGMDGAMPTENALENMWGVIRGIGETKDSHALWSHKGERISPYVIPKIIESQLEERFERAPRPFTPAYNGSGAKMEAGATASLTPEAPNPTKTRANSLS